MANGPTERFPMLAAALTAVCFSFPTFAAAPSSHETPVQQHSREKLASILAGFDETQELTRTLTASFTERKDLRLLKKPVVSKGSFYYTRPDDILWEYREPDPRYFLISKSELLTYDPTLKKAERVSITLYHDRLLRVLAIGQPSKSLRKYYDIALDEEANAIPETWLLVLTPRKRSVRKRIEEVRLWVSKDRALPVQIQWMEPDRDSTTIRFENVQFNPEIQASVYRIEIPKDVKVKRGFSGMAPPGSRADEEGEG